MPPAIFDHIIRFQQSHKNIMFLNVDLTCR